jgi:Multicopper oxidase
MPGIWLYHCHISDHMLAGMVARYEVKARPAGTPQETSQKQHGTSGQL